MEVLIFLASFLILFILSREFSKLLSVVFFRITRHHGLSIQLLSLFFLPGVIIHELSHWFMASIFFVPTGEIEFLPQVEGDTVKLGSVQVAKTDPMRRFFIGIAPALCGITVIFGIFWYLRPEFWPINWVSVIFYYIVFEIGNTMFSSKKDLEGVIGFFIFAVLIIVFLFFLHVPVLSYLSIFFNEQIVRQLLFQVTIFLLVAAGIDILFIGILRLVFLSLKSFI